MNGGFWKHGLNANVIKLAPHGVRNRYLNDIGLDARCTAHAN